MSDSPGDIILLAPDDEIRRSVLGALPGARPYASPLEALADLATAPARALITTPAALGCRAAEILGAVRAARPESLIVVACRPEEEPQAMKIAGADDYFLVPFGLAALARRVLPAEAGPGTARAGAEGERDAGPAASDVGLRAAVYDGLQAIARAARQPAGRIADQTVKAVARFDGVSAAAVLTGRETPAPAAARGAKADWSAAAAALARPDVPQDRWVQADSLTWVYVPVGTGGTGPAMAVRMGSAAHGERLLDALSALARVSLALVSAARDREAALKVLSTDAETGLASRRYIAHYLPALCRLAAESRREVALALVSPTGDPAMARTALVPLASLMTESFPSAKLARTGDRELAAVFAGVPAQTLAAQLEAFAARVDEAALSVPVAIASATFPWHGPDAGGLLGAAERHLAQSVRTGRPVIQ